MRRPTRSRQRLIAFLLGLLLVLLPIGRPVFSAASQPAHSAAPRPTNPAAPTPSRAARLDQQARAAFAAGDAVQAAALWRQAGEAYGAAGDRLAQARMLSNLALAQQQLGQPREAQRSSAASLALLESEAAAFAGSPALLRSRAQALHTQGRLQFERGDYPEALRSWRQAEQLQRQVGATDAALASAINQAEALQRLGNLEEARALLESLTGRAALRAQPRLEAAALASLAATLQRQGQESLALRLQQRSLAIAQASGDATAIREAHLGLADNLAAQGATAAALGQYQQAAGGAESRAPLPADLGRLTMLIDTNQYSGAGRLWPLLLRRSESLPGHAAALEVRLQLAQQLLRLRQVGDVLPAALTPPEAALRALLQRAQADAAALGDPRAASLAAGNLGWLSELSGQGAEAERLSQQALQLAVSARAPELSTRWLAQLGRLARQRGDRATALSRFEEAIREQRPLRRDLASASAREQSAFRATVEPLFRDYIDLLTREGADPATVATGADLDRARLAIEELQIAELNDYFRAACLQPQATPLERLDPQAAVLYPFLLPDRLEVIARLPGAQGALVHHSTPLVAGTLERSVAILERQLQQPPSGNGEIPASLLSAAQELHRWLLAPLEASLQTSGARRLVFVPDRALRNVPMAVLHDGQGYLGERYGIALAPGLLVPPSAPRVQGRLRVLLAGLSEASEGVEALPVGSNRFPALPAVTTEIDRLARLTGGSRLLNGAFTPASLRDALRSGDYAVVHLATHGQFSSRLDDTFLLTGGNNRIGVEQLRGLLEPTRRMSGNSLDLLVLSACQGAMGETDANLGLAAVAVRSGASSTLASLWSVNDDATAKLMDAFYRHWLQAGNSSGRPISKVEALARAQADLRNAADTRHPYYWAAFTLLGNWS